LPVTIVHRIAAGHHDLQHEVWASLVTLMLEILVRPP